MIHLHIDRSRAGVGLVLAALAAGCALNGAEDQDPSQRVGHVVALPGCEAGAGGSAGGDGTSGGGAGIAGSAGAGSTSSAIRFNVTVPGAATPVAERVASKTSSGIEVSAYPKQLALPVAHGPLTVGFDGAFSEAFCNDVRNTAQLAVTSPALREQVLRLVRRQGGVVARLPVTTLVGPDFLVLSVTAARAAGAASAAHIVNPLQLGSVTLSLQLSSDALTNVLGDPESIVAPIRDALKLQASTVAQTGQLAIALSAKDLWCDLARGKATFKFTIAGTAGTQAYAGETLLTHVKPL